MGNNTQKTREKKQFKDKELRDASNRYENFSLEELRRYVNLEGKFLKRHEKNTPFSKTELRRYADVLAVHNDRISLQNDNLPINDSIKLALKKHTLNKAENKWAKEQYKAEKKRAREINGKCKKKTSPARAA